MAEDSLRLLNCQFKLMQLAIASERVYAPGEFDEKFGVKRDADGKFATKAGMNIPKPAAEKVTSGSKAGDRFASVVGNALVRSPDTLHAANHILIEGGIHRDILEIARIQNQARMRDITYMYPTGTSQQHEELPDIVPTSPIEDIKNLIGSTQKDIAKFKELLKTDRGEAGKFAGIMVGNVVQRAIPLALYTTLTIGPDIVIGLALSESLPLILGGFAATKLALYATDKAMDAAQIKNPATRAYINIAISLTSLRTVKGIVKMVGDAKLGAEGVHQLMESGKNADDILNTFKTIQETVKRSLSPSAIEKDKKIAENLLSTISRTAKNAPSSPFTNLLKDTGLFYATHLRKNTKDMERFISHELSKAPDLAKDLKSAGVDPKKFTQRLVEMSDIEKLPPAMQGRRLTEIENLIKRAKEIPEARKQAEEVPKLTKAYLEEVQRVDELHKTIQKNNGSLSPQDWQDIYKLTDQHSGILKKALGVKWRSQFINAEIEHGAHLDRFLHSTTSEGQREGYRFFLGSLVKPGVSKAVVKGMSHEETKAFVDQRRAAEPMGQAFLDEWTTVKEHREEAIEAARKTAELFGRMIPKELKFDITSYGMRASAVQLMEANKKVKQIIDISYAGKDQVFHEMSHLMEFADDAVRDTAIAYRESRRYLPGLKSLMFDGGTAGEMGIAGLFKLGRYAGKVYPFNVASEIVPMALENLAVARKLQKAAFMDREHMMFALGALSHG
ncbi:MAG: hypothetical protein WBB28_01590 [Crinalium sp.]